MRPAESTIHHAPTFKDFSADTTIHGVPDAVTSRNAFSRCVWTLLVCFSSTAAALGIYQTIRGYLDRPLATQVKQLGCDTYPYPSLVFCPQSWINASRAKHMNFSKDDLAYALSFVPMVQLEHRIDDIEKAATRFGQKMDENHLRDLFDFYKSISFDSERIMTCDHCVTWPAPKRLIERGVCYELTFKDAEKYGLTDYLHPPYFQYDPPPLPEESISLIPRYTSFTPIDRLYVGMEYNDFFNSNAEKLKQNSSYLVKIVPSLQKRLNIKGRSSCMANEEYRKRNISLEMCYADCEQRIYGQRCWGFVHLGYFIGSTAAMNVPLWSSYRHDSIDPSTWSDCELAQKAKYDACAKRCLPSCEEWMYKSQVIEVNTRRLLTDAEEALITVVFNYQVRSDAFLMEEKATYTWDTFLSDVGGQMVLWLGGSVLSICQLVFFLFRWVEYQLQTKAEKAIEQSRHASGIVDTPA